MNCCQCEAIEREFNRKAVAKELKEYRKKGLEWVDKTTRILIDALQAQGIKGMTLLDIGGGIGVIQHELLKAGVSRATHIDASSAYVEAAKEEAERLGLADRISHRHGNFVDLAPSIETADIVTLDKVVCCYHDMQNLIRLSSTKAHKLYGLVYPRDNWWIKIAQSIFNFTNWLRRSPFRGFVHPTKAVDGLVRENGMERRFHTKTALWQMVVYSR